MHIPITYVLCISPVRKDGSLLATTPEKRAKENEIIDKLSTASPCDGGSSFSFDVGLSF